MRKSWATCKIFLLSAKRSLISVSIIIIIASLCINLLPVLLFEYTSNFDKVNEELNGEDNVFLFIGTNTETLKSEIKKNLDSNEQVKDYELLDAKFFWGACKYGNGMFMCYMFPTKKSDAMNKSIGKYKIAKEDPNISGVYLPYSFYASKNYDIGDDFTVTDNANSETTKVAGFYYSTLTDSNLSAVALIYDDDIYFEIEGTFPLQSVITSVQVVDPSYSSQLEKDFPSIIECSVFGSKLVKQCKLQSAKITRYVMPIISSACIAVASIIFLIVMLVALNVYITTYINDRRKNFGILKAMGYTNNIITKPIIALFIVLTLICYFIGVGLFYLIFPYLNTIFEGQVGIPYKIHFIPTITLISLLIILLNVYISVKISLNIIKSISPVEAITHPRSQNSSKNHHFSLRKTKLPLNLALSVNGVITRLRQTVVVFIAMIVISYSLVFMISQLDLALMDKDETVGILFGETCDVSAFITVNNKDEFENLLSNDENVESFVSYNVLNVDHVGGERLYALIAEDFNKLKNTETYYEGHYPNNENEVAIAGKYAIDNNIKIGDTIEFTLNNVTAKYTVCGYNQSIRYSGLDCSFTRAGYERIKTIFDDQYYIQLKNNVDSDQFIQNLRSNEITSSVTDSKAYQIAMIEPYAQIINSIAWLLVIISIFVMFFVIYNLTTYVLKTKETSFGILKAIGLTSKDLLSQTIFEISIPVILATLIGTTISFFTIGPMVSAFTYRVGVVKSFIKTPLLWTVIAVVSLILLVILFVYLLSLRIKRLVPKKLIGGQ